METNVDFEIKEKRKLKEPKKYKVILLNDDYSTIDFVIDVLITIFKKNEEEATRLTLDIHNNKKAVCGIYTYEIAITKVAEVTSKAKQAQFPLKAIVEEE